ncbi:hypothetical protein [Clostridium baratii]|uniref:hypothetical protein n=1 Tax=Clostridium baratii TaxID=1561 RepID=UPI0030D0BF53
MAAKKGKEEKKKERIGKKEKLARQILENKGIDFDTWLEEQFQNVADDNIELIVNSLKTSKELEE